MKYAVAVHECDTLREFFNQTIRCRFEYEVTGIPFSVFCSKQDAFVSSGISVAFCSKERVEQAFTLRTGKFFEDTSGFENFFREVRDRFYSGSLVEVLRYFFTELEGSFKKVREATDLLLEELNVAYKQAGARFDRLAREAQITGRFITVDAEADTRFLIRRYAELVFLANLERYLDATAASA